MQFCFHQSTKNTRSALRRAFTPSLSCPFREILLQQNLSFYFCYIHRCHTPLSYFDDGTAVNIFGTLNFFAPYPHVVNTSDTPDLWTALLSSILLEESSRVIIIANVDKRGMDGWRARETLRGMCDWWRLDQWDTWELPFNKMKHG